MLKKLLLAAGVLSLSHAASAANIVFVTSGSIQPLSTTLTNPYDGVTLSVNGTYNVTTGVYNGLATNFNTLLFTNGADFFLLDDAGVQTAFNMNRIVTGDGGDIIDFASSLFTVGGMDFFGGAQNDVIWANAGNDNFHFPPFGGAGHDTYDGGPGTDTLVLPFALASYTITRTGPASFTVTDGTSTADITSIEFAQFSDQTIDLSSIQPIATDVPVAEPATLVLLASGLSLMARRVRVASRRCRAQAKDEECCDNAAG